MKGNLIFAQIRLLFAIHLIYTWSYRGIKQSKVTSSNLKVTPMKLPLWSVIARVYGWVTSVTSFFRKHRVHVNKGRERVYMAHIENNRENEVTQVTSRDPRFRDALFTHQVKYVLESLGLPVTFEIFQHLDSMWNPDTPSLDWAALSTNPPEPIAIVDLVDLDGVRRGTCGMPKSEIDPQFHIVREWL